MRTLLENFGQIYSNSLFLEDLFEFLSLQPQVVDPTTPVSLYTLPAPPASEVAGDGIEEAVDSTQIRHTTVDEYSGTRSETGPSGTTNLQVSIRFSDVTFRYPGTSRTILQNFTLEIPAGKVAAIVGSNGAGKSTLVKLLCRFYDPEAGRVEINGVDLRALSLDEWRRQITVLFQAPVQYNATVSENISLGDLAVAPDLAAVQTAAAGAGADQVAERLPQGYDTLLGVWFSGGTDLSAGEWQRIALARAYLRQASLLILDEPTSAMDPWAEADWLARFRRLAEGRTALVITHRFTTARYADVIHVLEAGHIVESGSHEELLALQGRYAQSWNEQMRHRTGPAV